MTGYCVTIIQGTERYPFICNVFLVDSKEGIDPIEAIKEYSKSDVNLPWPVEDWDDHEEDIEWFPVRCVERLKSIEWPTASNDSEAEYRFKTQIQTYRAFKIRQVPLRQALEESDSNVINRALALGWEPRKLEHALDLLANSVPESEQAAIYRESIMDMSEDIAEAVGAAESIYEQDADNFLEEEGKPPGPKATKNMTDEELIEEATQLYGVISVSDCYGVDDLVRLRALESQIVCRGYEIRVGSEYSVQKIEEE